MSMHRTCCCAEGCFPDCQAVPTNSPSYFDTCYSYTETLNTTKFFTDAGTYFEWKYRKSYGGPVDIDLVIRCDKATGEVAATILDAASDSDWGGSDSIWPTFKVITDLLTCVAGNLAGGFDLDYIGTNALCFGNTVTVAMN